MSTLQHRYRVAARGVMNTPWSPDHSSATKG